VRHGATEWNHTKRAQGQADIALNDAGREQAESAALALADLDIVAVYASDLSRARDTAAPIARTHDLEVVTDPDFREIDQGEWEGLQVDDIKKAWPEMWGAARHYSTRPGGESPAQVRERALAGIKRIVKAHPEGTVVVVSHGGTIRWLSAEAMGYNDGYSARLRGVSNGGAVSFQASLNGDDLVLSDLVRMDGSGTDLDDPNV
jgi:broad specificity phosphatase PhoE